MRKNYFFFKSLLLATVLLLGSANAWGTPTIIKSWDFDAATDAVADQTVLPSSGTTKIGKTDCNNLTGDFEGITIQASGGWHIYHKTSKGTLAGKGYYNNNSGGRLFGILDLQAGDIVHITASAGLPTSATNGTYDSEKSTEGTDCYYTVTANGAFAVSLPRYNYIHVATVTRDLADIENPTYTITGANGIQREVTLACLTDGAEIKYNTVNDIEAGGWTTYTAPFFTSEETLYAYSEKSSSKSDVVTITTGAGSIVPLVKPIMWTSALTPKGSYYTPTFSFQNGDNSGVIGSPSATLTATFNGNALLGFDGTFTPVKDGTLVVTSSADGYESSQITVNCFAIYTQSWQSVDYSALTEEDLASSYPAWTSFTDSRWSSWKDIGGSYTYNKVTDGNDGYAEYTFDTNLRIRRNVAALVPTYGIGRNSNETLKVVNANDNDIIALKIYNGYGNYSVADAHWFSYNLRNGSDVTFTLNNSSLLVQATFYTPVPSVSVTISDAGFATLYSAYALDFEHATAGLEAYTATLDGVTVDLKKVDNVPAETGVVLKADAGTYNIPVIASSATAKGSLEGNVSAATAWNAFAGDNLDIYGLALSKEEAGKVEFAKITDGSVAPGKAFLKVSNTLAKSLRVVVDGQTTDVTAPEVAETEEPEVLVNLAGIPVGKDYKGIVINQKGEKKLQK